MGAYHSDEGANLAEMVHADLEHAISALLRKGGETERHTPVIVVGRSRDMRGTERAQRQPQHFLRRRLSGTSRHRHDLRVRAVPRRAREVFEAALRVGNGKKGAVRGDTGNGARHKGCSRLRGKSCADEIMAVTRLALERHEEIAGPERARIDRQARRREGPAGMTQRRDFGVGRCPQDAHARPPCASAAWMAASRSENGLISAPTIWPVS